MDYYEEVSGSKLANEFHAELIMAFERAAKTPTRFHLVTDSLRRVNLKKFPYHFLFLDLPDRVRFLVLRHHRRDPEYGTDWELSNDCLRPRREDEKETTQAAEEEVNLMRGGWS